MKHRVKNKNKQLNMTVYSGHDFTIGTVLTALGIFDGNCPDYTSTIIMELLHGTWYTKYFLNPVFRIVCYVDL